MGGGGDAAARVCGAESKKLLGLGRFWTGADRQAEIDPDRLRAEMQADGVPEAEIARIETTVRQRQEEIHYTVWGEHWRAWQVFQRVCHQWRYAGLGDAVAIDGAVLLGVVNLVERKRKARLRLFDEVGLIARGALQAWREQRERERALRAKR